MSDLVETEFVNRDEELRRIREMLAGQRRTSILLIRATDGMGKSWLLRRAYLEHRHQPTALLLFGHAQMDDTVSFVQALRTQLPGLNWTTVTQLLREMGRTYSFTVRHTGTARPPGNLQLGDNAEVSGDVFTGDKYDFSNISLPGATDPTERSYQVGELVDALMVTLCAIPAGAPVLLLLDGYRQRTYQVEQWLLQRLLPDMRDGRLPAIKLVLAGEEIPQFDREWRAAVEATELTGFAEAAIREYWVGQRGLPNSDVPQVVRLSGGIPLLLAQMADNASQPQLSPTP